MIQKYRQWKEDIKRDYLLFFISVVLFSQIIILQRNTHKPQVIISLQQEVVNIAPEIISIFSLGQNHAISSLLWVETMLKSDLEHYHGHDLKSWMYLRFNTITHLNPYFYEAYLYGGIYLSVIKDDDLGAKQLFDKGIKLYPNKYPLLFQAGFHYFSELQNDKKAIEIFEKALYKDKMHSFLPTLVARLKSGAGDLEGAKLLLSQRLESLPPDTNPHIIAKLKNNLYAVHAEIDLNCLNDHNKKNCNTLDYFGNKYLHNKKYYSSRKWEPYRKYKKNN